MTRSAVAVLAALVAFTIGVAIYIITNGSDWENEVRSFTRDDLETSADRAAACSAVTLFGVDSGEEFADVAGLFLDSFGDSTVTLDLPMNELMAQADTDELIDLPDITYPDDVTARDVIVVAADEIISECR